MINIKQASYKTLNDTPFDMLLCKYIW